MTTQIQDLDIRLRNRLEEIVGQQKFRVWFKNSTQLTCADGFVKIGVPNMFIGQWIEDHFSEVLTQAGRDVLGHDVQVTFAIDPVLFRNLRKNQLNSQAAFIEKNTAATPRTKPNGHSGAETPTTRKLRGRLENFVVGPSNRLAHSVALSLVENPTADGTPIFFHSSCGLGKTHLLQGIANALTQTQPHVRWLYATGEEFTNQFLYALRERRLDAFRHRYREIDVLLLDDMQFLANKKATQEEFFHTFNAIEGCGKRVALASDAHPRMIADLSQPLVSRLVAGMIVRIERPDFETRSEILRRRVAQSHQEIPEAVIEYIADKIQSNVRELEGCLLKLVACASLMKTRITLELARQTLDDHLRQSDRILSAGDIEHSVATFFGLTPADLHTSRKSRTIALARNVAMFLARKHTKLSFPEIARVMGNKNHTTVLLACRRLEKLLEKNAEVTWQSAAGLQTRPLSSILEAQREQLRV